MKKKSVRKKTAAKKPVTKARHPFFKGMPQQLQKMILKDASIITLAKRNDVFTNGAKAECFYLILKGKVDILSEEQDVRFDTEAKMGVLTSLGAGEIVGWSWLIPPYHWRFHAVTQTEAELLVIDGVSLRKKMEKNHLLAHEIYRKLVPVMNNRLIAARLKLQMFGSKPFATAEGG